MIVAISSLITLVGLWCVLRKYFTAGVTILTLLLLILGTNFFLMSVYSGAVQASILLALMVLVVWMTQRWYEKPGWAEVIIAGLAMACLVFIKPAGFASVFLFFFWGAYNKETFNKKWRLFKENTMKVILIFGLFFTGLILRLVFPHAFENTMLSDYMEHKRVLYLIAPFLWQVMFSIRNGWLIYTPLVLFSIPGFYILANRNKRIFYAVFLFSLNFVFLLASSPDVIAPNNFSQSRMTEIFAVLFIPVGYFIGWVMEGSWLRKTAFLLVLAALVGLNLFQTWQYRNKILNPWFTSPGYYKAVFLKTHVSPETRMLQSFSNMDMSSYLANENDFNIKTLVESGYENNPGAFGGHFQTKIFHAGQAALRLDDDLRFTPSLSMPVSKLPANELMGIRLSAWVYSETDFSENTANMIITLSHHRGLYHYKALAISTLPLEKGKWNKVQLDYVISRQLDPSDELIPYIWYTGKSAIYIDDLKVELFEQK